VDVEENFGGEL